MIVVHIGQVWRITEPSGNVREFEITHLVRGIHQNRIAHGRTCGGRIIKCPVSRLERGEHGAVLLRTYERTAP